MPSVRSAVESASLSVADCTLTAARMALLAGEPVRGSITCPYVAPAVWNDLPQTAETDNALSRKETTDSGVFAEPLFSTGGRSIAIFQASRSGGQPIAN